MSSGPVDQGSSAGKLHALQALRGIAVLLVIWVHISAPHGFEARYIGGPRFTRWMHFPTLISIDLFFIISGVIITTTSWRSFESPSAWRQFVYRRVTRIYPLYLIVTVLILIVFLARPDLVNSQDIHRPEILPSLLILPQPGDPLLGVGWTLVYELQFYAIFTVSLCFARRWLPWILGCWALVTVVLHIAVAPTRNPYLYVVSNPINLEFVFGACIGFLVVRRLLINPRLLLGAAVLSLTALLGYLIATAPPNFPSAWFQVGAIGASIAVAVYAVIGLELGRRITVPRLIERIGDGSYSIYLWHVPILAVVGLVIERVGPRPLVPHVVALVSVFAITVVAGLWLYDLLERPLLRAFHTRLLNTPVAEKTWQPAKRI